MATELQLELNETDRRIWEEELDEFVPQRVFDVHTHIYRWQFNTDAAKDSTPLGDLIGRQFPESNWVVLDACDAALMPGREVHRLSFPFPFSPSCDYAASNRFVAEQVGSDPLSAGLMVVHPSMREEYLEEQIDALGLIGLKPYRFYSSNGDAVSCRITDMLPEHQIAVADRHGLIIMLHLSKRHGIGDPDNVADIIRLSSRYPSAKWILAHCGRSYSSWPIERAASRLGGLPNVWYDTSSVCESDAIEALCIGVGVNRVMYGSDDLPVGAARGKYITFGYAWTYLHESNHLFDLSDCDASMTFVRYEQLRAMRRAARRLGLTRPQINDLFYHTAMRLVELVRGNVEVA